METHNETNNEVSKGQTPDNATQYWKTLEQWSQDPTYAKWAEDEFIKSPFAVHEEEMKTGQARRDFLKLMGASIALSQMACIRRPAQKIIPYSKKPQEITPGIANYYTSTWVDGGETYGLVVKTREGRPIKVEGNPAHPSNRGALSAKAQAQILNLYDPDRIRGPKKFKRNEAHPWHKKLDLVYSEADKEISSLLREGGVALLTGSLGSPSTKALISDFSRLTGAEHFAWDALSSDDVRAGQEASYGSNLVPRYRFDRAKMIVSIDCDFLGTWISPVEFTKQFATGRKLGAEMSKFVAFESLLSTTGSNADFRVRIAASQQVDVAMGLLHEIIVRAGKSGYAGDGAVKSALAPFADTAAKLGIEKALFMRIANDLWEKRGASLVVAGGLATRRGNSEALQIAVNFLNSVLGNDGATVDHGNAFVALEGGYGEMASLIEKMKAGKVKTLIIHRVNPVYALPADSGFTEALAKVKTVIYTGDRIDETGSYAGYIFPDHHHLENWGDSESHRGVYSVQQPTIRPMFETRAFQDSLIAWAGGKVGAKDWYSYVKEYWKRAVYPSYGRGSSFDDFWEGVLQTGVVGEANVHTSSGRGFRTTALQKVKTSPGSADSTANFELVIYPTVPLGDGSYANIAWLQELPDPVTKIVWDSYVTVSYKTAQELHLREGDVVELKSGEQTMALPVLVQPGQHDRVLGLAVGKGRKGVGAVGDGVGINAWVLASFNGGKPKFGGMAEIKKTGKFDPLGNVAGHNSMEGRQIVVEATLAQYLQNQEANIHRHEVVTMWDKHKYPGHKWGMAIDLSSCTGCSACVVACQSENNIPTVGKKLILTGREMHWIRIDRYYAGNPETPSTLFQPMLCQHCDNAPCETVCPVVATVHNEEGLNDMAYNRCVGTRYCSNNCPYKVRRFNWFNYSKIQAPLEMAANPDVTIRSRGVMEKCTFCTQRITEKKNFAKDRGTPLQDGEIKVACEQTCPTNAIVFGDMNDPGSRVAKLFKEKRGYEVLEELNNVSSVRYLSKIRNNDYSKDTSHGEKGGHA